MTEIQEIEIKLLKSLERNPRRISKDQMEKLVKSLEDDPAFLNCRPILVNLIGNADKQTYQVYAGNQRLAAAKKLKWKTVPCIVEDNLSEEIMKQRIIKDNKTYGEFDFDILANEWDESILLNAGFTSEEIPSFDIENIENTDEEDNQVLEPVKDEDARTKPGDLYELNSHRIVCGDSVSVDSVNLCLAGAEPILMVTDPPYGVNYDPSWRTHVKGSKDHIFSTGKVQNDDKINWALAWHLFPGSIAYIWHAGKYTAEVEKSLRDSEFEIISQIIWKKQNFVFGRGDYHWHHEPCWYANKKGNKHNWQGARNESTIWEVSNLAAFGKSKEEDERTSHSTQKPIECMARPIRNNTCEGEGVYDPFLGSGTTLIAAEKLNRICYGIELSPAYCDIIVDRWVKFMMKNSKDFSLKLNGKKIKWELNDKPISNGKSIDEILKEHK